MRQILCFMTGLLLILLALFFIAGGVLFLLNEKNLIGIPVFLKIKEIWLTGTLLVLSLLGLSMMTGFAYVMGCYAWSASGLS